MEPNLPFNSDDEMDLEGYIIEEYGRGYLLTCEDTHKDYGTKYYHGGWWNTSANGWFFKKEFLFLSFLRVFSIFFLMKA